MIAWFALIGVVNAAPALTGESCKVKPLIKWSEQEKWTWKQICEGKTADLANHYGGTDNPNQASQWPKNRGLSANFLQTILLHEPWRSSISNLGVEIIGAKFSEDIQLKEAHLNVSLYLGNCLIRNINMEDYGTTQNVNIQNSIIRTLKLTRAIIDGQLVLDGSTITGLLNMESIKINDSALLRKIHVAELNLMYGYIGRQLTLEDSTIVNNLNMNTTIIKQDVILDRSNFHGNTLCGADIGGLLKLINATVNDKLSMINISIKLDLFLTDGNFQDIDLKNANIGGNLNLDNATVTGLLNMESVKIGQSAQIRGANIAVINLLYGNIGEQLAIEDSKISDDLIMDITTIKKDILLLRSKFRNVHLSGADIGGLLSFKDTAIDELLYMRNTTVEKDVLFDGTRLFSNAILYYLTAGGNLDLRNGIFNSLNLTGSSIGHDFILGSKDLLPPVWSNTNTQTQSAKLILRNASVNAIQDHENSDKSCKRKGFPTCRTDAWPRKMELDGFKFDHLGVIDVDEYSDMSKRPVEWWIGWLGRNQSFSPQPYQMVADVLRNMGKAGDADEVLYAGKNAERDMTSFPGNLLLWLQWAMVGYGYVMLRSLIWIAALVSCGVYVLHHFGESRKVSAYLRPIGYPQRTPRRELAVYWIDLMAYSFDMLLPIIRLRDAHYAIDLEGYTRYYFYLHRLLGWVLGAFLVAGISGLTK